MTKKTKRHIIASVGTALFMLLLLLILWLARMVTIVPEQEEGIEVAFGDVENAGGFMAEQSEIVPLPTEPTTPPAAASDNELLTQEDDEALALQQRQREQREREQRERELREQQEREQREAAEAAERARQQEAIDRANEMGALFGQTGNTNGTGDTQGNGHRGNPVGHGSSGGNDWSLSGRSLRGSLPQPSTSFNQEGKVIVEIRVNAAGTVVSAKHKGGTISDRATIQLAIDAALKAKFTEGDHDQIGTITYNFKFN